MSIRFVTKKIALGLTALLFAWGALPACSDGAKSGGSNGLPDGTLTPNETPAYEGGTHVFEIGETPWFLTENGASAYTVVVPASPEEFDLTGASEFVAFFGEATGIGLTETADAAAVYDASAALISFGKTQAAAAAGVTAEGLGESGYRIRTVGRSVFVVGGRYGTMYGAYELLRLLFGFDTFAAGAYSLRHAEGDLPLPAFDVTDIPDIAWRIGNYGSVNNDMGLLHRMRMFTFGDVWMRTGSKYWHNQLDILPRTEFEKHTDWYSQDGTQLCFSRGGEEMVDAVTEKLKTIIEANPKLDNVTFTQMDKNTWCGCAACSRSRDKYGTDAAVQIQFVNRVAKKIAAWLDETDPGRRVVITIFAYFTTTQAPVKKNEAGQYVPIDESVVLEDNVAVLYAPISADFSKSFYDADNSGFAEIMKAWGALTDRMYVWFYSTNFTYYLLPYDSFGAMADNYRFAASCGAEYMFDQAQIDNAASTAFGTLKAYLNAKLQWNVNADVGKLTDAFFAGYYGPASDAMRELYDGLRAHLARIGSETDFNGYLYLSALSKQYWDFGTLAHWTALLERAGQAIQPLSETDPAEYEALAGRIGLESLFVRYLCIELYGSNYLPSELLAMKRAFKETALAVNVDRIDEGGSISNLFDKWGV